ncbi:hypothetical protein STENM327S_06087 [Streptomyces tendae]
MPKHALRRVMSATAAAGALALGLTDATAHATPATLDYVALGDSYSAGSGVLPVDPTNLLCLRSTANYPHVIAATTGAHLKDVTCGAAQTAHFSQAQYPGVAPQLDALDAGTDLVTLTIAATTTTPSSTPSRPAARRVFSAVARAAPARTATAPPSTTRSRPTPIPPSRTRS